MFGRKKQVFAIKPEMVLRTVSIEEAPTYYTDLYYKEISKRYDLSEFTGHILDNGISLHQDLVRNIRCRYNHTSDSGLDGDHGTHVASHAVGDFTGILDLMGLSSEKVLHNDGAGSFKEYAKGIRKTRERGAVIMGNSLGAQTSSKIVDKEIDPFLESPYHFFICASGNGGENDRTDYPANKSKYHKNVITVGSGDYNGGSPLRSRFTSVGENTLIAQGEEVYGCITGNQYAAWNGSSMAQPQVFALIAISIHFFSERGLKFSCYDFHKLLKENGSCIDMDEDGFDGNTGYGFIVPAIFEGNNLIGGYLRNMEDMAKGITLQAEIPSDHFVKQKSGKFSWLSAFLGF